MMPCAPVGPRQLRPFVEATHRFAFFAAAFLFVSLQAAFLYRLFSPSVGAPPGAPTEGGQFTAVEPEAPTEGGQFTAVEPEAPKAGAQFTVVVSDEYRAIQYVNSAEILPDKLIAFEMPANGWGDTYTAFVRVAGPGVQLIVVDGRDVESKNPDPNFLLSVPLTTSQLELGKPPSDFSAAYLLNTTKEPIQVDIRVDRVGKRPADAREGMRRLVAVPVDVLGEIFRGPKLTVTVEPCGKTKPDSAPNITICTELLGQVFEREKANAIIPIVLHELGHSLLKAWNVPGWDNEDVLDEFTATLIAQKMPEVLDEYISWLEVDRNPAEEAAVKLAGGSPHTISLQRAQNLRRIRDNPDPVVKRWMEFLAPYLKPTPPQAVKGAVPTKEEIAT